MKVISRKTAVSVAACTLLASLAASPAHSRTFAEIYSECGLGAMLFNSGTDVGPNGRAFAIISNVTSDLGTTAISSDVLSEENCAGGSAVTASLMMETLPALERDIARGEGEYLDAVFGTAGCDVDSRPALTSALRVSLATTTDTSVSARAAVLYDGLADGAATMPGSCAI